MVRINPIKDDSVNNSVNPIGLVSNIVEIKTVELALPQTPIVDNVASKAIVAPIQTPSYDLRLSVERDFDTGEAVYRAINRVTGEVVRQFPSKEIMEMKKSMKYQAGFIIKMDV